MINEKYLFAVLLTLISVSGFSMEPAQGNTALHYACEHRNYYVIKMLAGMKGINLSIENKQRQTPADLLLKKLDNSEEALNALKILKTDS